MKLKYQINILFILILTGCGTVQKIEIDKKPEYQVPKKYTPIVVKKGSLYTRSGPSIFADKKDLQIGDIIKIEIEEKVFNASTSNRSSGQISNSNKGSGLTFAGTGASVKLNSGVGLGYTSDSSSKFTGNMSDKLGEEFETIVSAIIVDRYQNGNYLVKGEKEVLINNQKQKVLISGVIRPYDIDADNMIESQNIANLKVEYAQKGELMDRLEKPWGTKFLDMIWPF